MLIRIQISLRILSVLHKPHTTIIHCCILYRHTYPIPIILFRCTGCECYYCPTMLKRYRLYDYNTNTIPYTYYS